MAVLALRCPQKETKRARRVRFGEDVNVNEKVSQALMKF